MPLLTEDQHERVDMVLAILLTGFRALRDDIEMAYVIAFVEGCKEFAHLEPEVAFVRRHPDYLEVHHRAEEDAKAAMNEREPDA